MLNLGRRGTWCSLAVFGMLTCLANGQTLSGSDLSHALEKGVMSLLCGTLPRRSHLHDKKMRLRATRKPSGS
jgi:hypothetical protein